ncbi:MAG: efflux RND transporter periplasmic adaptor subunit [bacterium]|nr:efflux RND transporter periplasmic adaptor subunit [bacterium]
MKSKEDQKADSTLEDLRLEIEENLGLGASYRQRRRLKVGLLVVLCLVAAYALLVMIRNGADKAHSMHYKTQQAQRGDLTVTVTATGTLEPTNQVEVGSELSGIVKSVEVDYNDRVVVGQPLAWLDTEKLKARVVQGKASLQLAEARVLQAQATLAEASTKLERLRQLYQLSNQKVPAQHELDAAEAALKRAEADEASSRAQVSEARAELEVYQTELSKAAIRSPINGLVLKRNVEPGQTVAASLQAPVLFVLAEDLAQMELRVDVDEADVGQVKEGQEAIFTVDAFPGRKFPARVAKVHYAAKTVNGVVTYETILKVNNQDLSLRPGMTATAEIIVSRIKNALLVPNAALRFDYEALLENQKQPKESPNLLTMLLPRPGARRPASVRQKKPSVSSHQRLVWALSGGKPVAIPLTIGLSDGQMTEVKAGEIQPGLPLLVDVVRPGQ